MRGRSREDMPGRDGLNCCVASESVDRRSFRATPGSLLWDVSCEREEPEDDGRCEVLGRCRLSRCAVEDEAGSAGTGGGSMLDLNSGFFLSSAVDALCLSFLGDAEAGASAPSFLELGRVEGASSLVARIDVGAATLLRACFGVSDCPSMSLPFDRFDTDGRLRMLAFGVVGSTVVEVLASAGIFVFDSV